MDDIQSHVSLLDLSVQFPFEMDDSAKKELCFSETLIISCAHNDVDFGGDFSESEWSCAETESETEEIKVETVFVVNDLVEEEEKKVEEIEEDNNFQFFFFPDCAKPAAPQNSEDSIVMEAGMPKINPAKLLRQICVCPTDKHNKCLCYTELPCHCGAKKKHECKCSEMDAICTCKTDPTPVCICKSVDVCVCHPDQKPKTPCTCDDVAKPCICDASKFPYPVCTCKHKPKYDIETKEESELGEQMGEENSEQIPMVEVSPHEPCECQKPETPPRCKCRKGEDCICYAKSCVCGVQKSCICESDSQEDVECKSDDSKTVCSCPQLMLCTCGASPDDCKCFPKPVCNCGDPNNCKCFIPCICNDPCVCDVNIAIKKPSDVCDCPDTVTCTCSDEKGKKRPKALKRVKAGKHGYRWCNTVDPKNTYFDYAYGRHDKIIEKVQEKEKFKILGLHDEKKVDGPCPVHGVEAPPYKKKVRKPSIDCCSAVGGISISVETLGEGKDKFLVQVVSHSAKEGANTGSKLVSILDANLHTMEENRHEHIAKRDLIKERKSYMAICESGYYNKATRICGDRKVVKRLYHSFDDARDFLLEGANVVLLRYFSIKRYRGNVKTRTVLMDGTICESIYVSNGVSEAIVNGKPFFVVKVERHIIEPSGFMHQTLTVLSLRGYIVSHEWADNNYVMHVNPLLNVVTERDEIEQHAPLRENWRNDLQLFSDYLDFKSARTSDGGRYVIESGGLTGTVKDYLQALLMLRPQDALHFTRHYFGSALSALDLPYDEYFDPSSKHVRYFFFED